MVGTQVLLLFHTFSKISMLIREDCLKMCEIGSNYIVIYTPSYYPIQLSSLQGLTWASKKIGTDFLLLNRQFCGYFRFLYRSILANLLNSFQDRFSGVWNFSTRIQSLLCVCLMYRFFLYLATFRVNVEQKNGWKCTILSDFSLPPFALVLLSYTAHNKESFA